MASNQTLLGPEAELEAGSPQLELPLARPGEADCVQCFPALPPGERNFQFLNREEGFIKLSRWVWWQKIRTGSTHKAKKYRQTMVVGQNKTYASVHV
jgi:hypothetical protein